MSDTFVNPIMNVDELTFIYFPHAESKFGIRMTPYPPKWEEIDAILTGWERLVLESGCYLREWIISDQEYVSALMDQSDHLISAIYVIGHA